MYRTSDFTKPVYRAGEAAKLLGVTTNTLCYYSDQGKIRTVCSEGGHRLIIREDLIEFLDKRGMLFDDSQQEKRDVTYARVSSYDQKKDLDRQALIVLIKVANI